MPDKEQQRTKVTATVAPGIDDQEELNENASQQDIAKDNTTKVTRLSFDEVDPS